MHWQYGLLQRIHPLCIPSHHISLLIGTYAFDKVIAERLVANGINSPAAFEGVEASDLVGFGFTEEEAAGLIAKVSGS